MNNSRPDNILISETSLSEGFKEVMYHHEVKSIAELLSLTKEQLTSLPGFTFKMLVEYRNYLEANNLESK